MNTTSPVSVRAMTRFWHRRSSEAIVLAALVSGGAAAWQLVASGTFTSLDQLLIEPPIAPILALVTVIVVAISYIAAPARHLLLSAQINYLLLCTTLLVLTLQTGGPASSYFGLLIVTLGFAGFFRHLGVAIGVGLYTLLLAWLFLVSTEQSNDRIIAAMLGGLPLIIGMLLWGRGAKDTPADDRAYDELANELSQVAGKAEVVINAIGDGVLALDNQGIIRLINPAAQRLLGWGKHDSLGLAYKSVFKMLTPKNQEVDYMSDLVAQALANNQPEKQDTLSLQTQSGKTFLASISVSPVGQPGQGVIVVFRDITAEKSDERQRAEFISTASHEMRTPVASIEGYLGLALNPATATIDEKARDFITKAHESAQHLGRLFQDLLDVSKADDGRLTNNPTVIDVAPFLHEIVQGLTAKATEKGLGILYKPIPTTDEDELARHLNPVYYVNADRDHLREVSDNLIENAIKYTPKGNVVIDVGGDQSHVVISIQDTGIGIPREDQAHLFQKFYRVDNSDTREIGGTGLGLYLCRRLVETMGGRIWVESEYKKGSTFFVELPRLEHDDAMRLIEQASILAEQRAEIEAAQAAASATQPIAPVQAAPQPATPVAPTSNFTHQSPPAGTPLSAIEANPSQYLSRRPAPQPSQEQTWRQ